MNALEAKHITKTYANHIALDDVSITVPEGAVFGLLGPNGAGKTSLIRIINQITGPDSGEIQLFGEKLQAKHISTIGYLPEERGLYKKMKVGEQALYLAQLKGMSKKEAKGKLDDWFERFEIGAWWNKKVEELSKGMAQKIQFVTTVLHEPKLLILDEPFSGFDPINVELIRSELMRLREQGASIILSTHNMGSVEEICDHIALINKSKKVLEGGVSAIREAHARQEYEIKYRGTAIAFANALWTNFELISQGQENGNQSAVVRLGDKMKLNDLLRAVVDHVELLDVNRKLPSMNDIFIQTVTQNEADHE